jgi:hypothetical protein
MGRTNVAVSEEAKRKLKWIRAFTASSNYTGAVEALVDESDYEIPDGDPTRAKMREVVMEGIRDDSG